MAEEKSITFEDFLTRVRSTEDDERRLMSFAVKKEFINVCVERSMATHALLCRDPGQSTNLRKLHQVSVCDRYGRRRRGNFSLRSFLS